MKIKLDKEYKIKINNNVLEKFEEESEMWTTPPDALEFKPKNFRQLRLMTKLALKEANEDVSDDIVSDYVSLDIVPAIYQEYQLCLIGKHERKRVEELIKESEKKGK